MPFGQVTAFGGFVFSWHWGFARLPRRRAAALAGAALVLGSCAPSAVALHDQLRTHDPPSTYETLNRPTGAPAAAVSAVDQQAAAQGNALGVAVLDRATGELSLGRNGQQPMYSASLSKIIVTVELLERGRATQQDRLLIQRALGPSDDEAMNALWDRHGGTSLITTGAERMNLQQTRPPEEPGRWGDTITSARDIAAVFQHLLGKTPPGDRDFVLRALHAAPEIAADGVNQKFGLMAVNAQAVKSGWMCCQQDKVWVHSAGVIDPDRKRYVVALLSAQPSSVGYGKAVDDLTAAARTALTPLR
ncbi:serine hydrolase [Saccharopolyspora mangrovi]|uniref:Serine hydrolase n=1 Tax=Saccharopolyspora mangrovi TaxID=3082379 RepID=A0ABU6AAH3_9PSEU|nr:serine hydrolase [Saccharopolyspora sp. S2-29]MEB3368560.1 serine hydrolase [Saccharopolyspora sp. S2-29]